MLSSKVKLTKDGRIGTKDSKTKDDQSDAWQEKIKHLKEYLETHPDAPDVAKKKAEIKKLRALIAHELYHNVFRPKGTKDYDNEEIGNYKGVVITLRRADHPSDDKYIANYKGKNLGESSSLKSIKEWIDRYTEADLKRIAGDSKTKDSKSEEAFEEGRKAYINKVNISNNPYKGKGFEKDWEDGWRWGQRTKSKDAASIIINKQEKTLDSYYGITTGQEIGKHNGYKLSLHKLENDNWLVAQRRGETLRTNVGGSIDSAITKMKKIIDGYSTLIQSAEESGITEDDALPVGLHNDTPDEEFDAEQLQMGIELEMEHTSDPEIAKAIAKDHLSEIKDYYTRLAKMEAEAGVKDCEKDAFPTGTREEKERLKQMIVNLETARRQGDQKEVKEFLEAIKKLEDKIAKTKDSKIKDALFDVIINRSGENHTYNDIEANDEDHARTKCISSLEKKLGLVSGALQKEYDGSKLNVEVKKKKD